MPFRPTYEIGVDGQGRAASSLDHLTGNTTVFSYNASSPDHVFFDEKRRGVSRAFDHDL